MHIVSVYRARLPITWLCLAIAASPVWSAPQIIPAAGLWEIASTGQMGKVTVQVCANGKETPSVLGISEQDRQETAKSFDCKNEPPVKSGGKTVYRTVCTGGGLHSEVISQASGDFRTSFATRIETRTQIKGAEPVSLVMESTGKRIGKCPAGMTPGDMKMPDGQIVKARKPEDAAKPATEPVMVKPIPMSLENEYKSSRDVKTFARSEDGHYGYSWAGTEVSRSMRSALSSCQKNATGLCTITDINGKAYESDVYSQFATNSNNLLVNMNIPSCQPYAQEAEDWGVAAPSGMDTPSKYHEKTPVALPGITTVSTCELAKLLKHGETTLIDTRSFQDQPFSTMPGAILIDWAGSKDGEDPSEAREHQLLENFEKVMSDIQPDKEKSVTVFCVSSECWMSIHAAMRLRKLGYRKVLWYRGGVMSWASAELPVIDCVPHATIWSR